MRNNDHFDSLDHVRAVRRRYLTRMARTGARKCATHARTPGAMAAVVGLFGLAMVSAPLWSMLH